MPRTTIDIDGPVLRDLKRLQKKEGKTLGRLVSDILAKALSQRSEPEPPRKPLQWHLIRGKPLVDLEDKEEVWRILDSEHLKRSE